MQIPVLSGIYTDAAADFRTSYPVNMMPVPKSTGVSSGYLRPAEGAIKLTTGSGAPRGGIEWRGKCYRVLGSNLVRIEQDNSLVVIGSVGDDALHSRCTFDYSFDKLAITSAGKMYYWDDVTLSQVVDADLGSPLAVKWVDGYFMTTDGTYLVVTELSDPFSINPLKYGSSEADPDPIKTILKLRNEIYAINRNTIEVFDNVGGDMFPFERIEGAQMQKGAIGSHAACVFVDNVAFLGSGRNESLAVYIGANGTVNKLSTREIDTLLATYTNLELESVVLEARIHAAHQHLWVRLPDRTLVYDLAATQIVGEPVWYQLTSAQSDFSQYRAVDLIRCYDKWLVADVLTGDCGYLDTSTARHFGAVARWEFGTAIAYNEGRGAIFNSIELVCLTGRVEAGEDPYISTSYSVDGVVWSQPRPIRIGVMGERTKRIAWFQQGHMTHWRIQRFSGDSRALLSIARIEAGIEALAV